MKFTNHTVLYRATWSPSSYNVVFYTNQKAITDWIKLQNRPDTTIENMRGNSWFTVNHLGEIDGVFCRDSWPHPWIRRRLNRIILR